MRKGIKATLIVFGASAGAVITYKLVKKIGKFLSELNEELAFEEEGDGCNGTDDVAGSEIVDVPGTETTE